MAPKGQKQKLVNCQNISTSKKKPWTSNCTPDHNQDTQSALNNLRVKYSCLGFWKKFHHSGQQQK